MRIHATRASLAKWPGIEAVTVCIYNRLRKFIRLPAFPQAGTAFGRRHPNDATRGTPV